MKRMVRRAVAQGPKLETDRQLGRQHVYISSLFSYHHKVKMWLDSLAGKKKGKKSKI